MGLDFKVRVLKDGTYTCQFWFVKKEDLDKLINFYFDEFKEENEEQNKQQLLFES